MEQCANPGYVAWSSLDMEHDPTALAWPPPLMGSLSHYDDATDPALTAVAGRARQGQALQAGGGGSTRGASRVVGGEGGDAAGGDGTPPERIPMPLLDSELARSVLGGSAAAFRAKALAARAAQQELEAESAKGAAAGGTDRA